MPYNPRVTTAQRQIARAAGTVMAAFVLSNLTGLVRQMLISRAFGTGTELDAFAAAQRLTDVLFNLVAGGALASAFVPTFTGFLAHDDRAGAWRLASGVLNLVFLALAAVSVPAWLLAPALVQYVAGARLPAGRSRRWPPACCACSCWRRPSSASAGC